ncbi:hypothetical protein RY831_30210 [Noviherbaspirillum sp. CPCC 100848]|uniref:NIF system FeS cluster assembly NifU N-terminal domain-containing protein n=1 Tax=Noviherbaspirillum album TaxID=3080276 RepID=A0ABU6JIR9_9BURK|nr:hypothetical protein [Noviherbaspirillum sp. CPCC 100848]MEC4723420.1 hypothetical protein [Noviherbaspirillum sp. CPCC 100848]
MTSAKEVSHSFLRTESDNAYKLIMAVEPHFIGQDVEIDLTDDARLRLTTGCGACLITVALADDIHHHLANKTTMAILADFEDNQVPTFAQPPLKPEIGGGRAFAGQG